MTSPVSAEIQLEDGSTVKQHFDQICKKCCSPPVGENIDRELEDADTFVSSPTEDFSVRSETVEEMPQLLSDSSDTLLSEMAEATASSMLNPESVSANKPVPAPKRNSLEFINHLRSLLIKEGGDVVT